MRALTAMEGGLAGSVVLTILHEVLKRADPDAPRMDLLGMNALTKILKGADAEVPAEKKLFGITMAGDLVSNALFYGLAGIGGKNQLQKGAMLGLAAGLGAVLLPKPLGLYEAPSTRTNKTKALTVALYFTGGLVAAGVMQWLKKNKR